MNKEYYLLDGEDKTGPFTYDELLNRGIDIHTQISTSLNNKWQYASEMPEFNQYFEAKGIYFPTEDNLATFGSRVLAFAIDYFPMYIIIEIIAVRVGWVTIPADYKLGQPIPDSLMTLYVSFSVIFLLYRTIMEASPLKATIGKRICKLIVVDIDGNSPTLLRSLGRNLGVLLSITLWVPFLSMLFSEHRQNWYDSLAKTYIVKTR